MVSSLSPAETGQPAPEELTYEQALAELESIVAILETDQRSLDETLALFARGQALANRCAVLLEQAELKVQQISGDTLSDFTTQP
jgi:exodeoxyribonuclease VII small subunit